jgi:TolB-like protein/Tfp pilus assembly protein PilF
MAARNEAAPKHARMEFRVGVNAGDAVLEGGDVFGEVVNLAARLQEAAQPGGVCVSARVREDAQGRADIAFEDAGEQRLKNIDRPIRVFRVRLDGPAAARPSLALPDKPSIAVLPFNNMSDDPSQEYFADAVSEDIISALSRWRWFFVIARNSSFIYRGRAVDVTQVGRELGVRYVLEGSVRKLRARVRVAAQLIDATTGAHIWSETFDRDLVDLFALHDEITERVVNAIEPAMLHSEGARVARKNLTDLSAFDCFQRGMWHLNQFSKDGFRAAQALFQEAISRDPETALGYTGLARVLYGWVYYSWSDDEKRDLKAAEAAARTSIGLDARDAWAHFALEEAARALALNPNFAFAHFRLGQVLTACGRPAEAVEPIERSIRHNPFDPQIGSMLTALALAHYHAGQFEAAAARASESLRLNFPRAAILLAASLARLERISEAQAVLTSQVQRAAMAGSWLVPYARLPNFQGLLEGLRLAGLAPRLAARLEARLRAD